MPSHEEKLAVLRQRAEELARASLLAPPQVDGQQTADATRKALHELQVYQIELEMQNEELRDVQVALDTERTRYQDLYDMAPVGYLTLGQGGEILHTNLKAASLLGLPRSQLVGKPLRRFVEKTDRDAFYLFIQQVILSQQPVQRDVQLVNADGAKLWVRMAVSAAGKSDGLPCLLVIMTDISDRKQAEETLYESEELHRSLFNSIDEGFCIIQVLFDAHNHPVDFRYLAVNPSFEKQSGLVNSQGHLASEVLPGLEREWLETYGRVVLTGESVRMTRRIASLGRWFDLFAFRTGPEHGRRVGVVFTDVTQAKQVEADRRFLDQVLLHKNAELQDAQVMAEKANLAKSDFLSGMSHELRTPLTAILGFAQLLDAGTPAPTPGQKRSLDQILKAGWYLLELINEILDLAVIESGKLTLNMQNVALASLLLECEAMVEVDARRRAISVQFDKTPALAHVHADRTRLKQALINLLSNAIKYNSADGSVRVLFNTDTPNRLRICIEDSGSGLTAEKIGQLFQPFNRLGQESRSEPGTGIGLVMTKQLVELMGGSIGVNSTVGKGSVFWIEMDRVGEHDVPAQQNPGARNSLGARAQAAVRAGLGAATAEPSVALSRRNLAGLYTLLYVEDNAANLLLVEELMGRRPDVRLVTARDGISGLAQARSNLPDVILLDTQLPDVSGMDLLRILVNDPQTARIPVVVLSANAMPGDIQAGLDAGCFHYLTKPVRVKELMQTLDQALKLDPQTIEPLTRLDQISQLGALT